MILNEFDDAPAPFEKMPAAGENDEKNKESEKKEADQGLGRLPPILPDAAAATERPDFVTYRSHGLADATASTRDYPQLNSKESSVIDELMDKMPRTSPKFSGQDDNWFTENRRKM